jgi:hypothetical protein
MGVGGCRDTWDSAASRRKAPTTGRRRAHDDDDQQREQSEEVTWPCHHRALAPCSTGQRARQNLNGAPSLVSIFVRSCFIDLLGGVSTGK